MKMRWIIIVLFLLGWASILTGFYIKSDDQQLGDLLIGLGIAGGVFIVMPLFLYHRWKNKNVNDYMLTKESFKKMRDHRDNKSL